MIAKTVIFTNERHDAASFFNKTNHRKLRFYSRTKFENHILA